MEENSGFFAFMNKIKNINDGVCDSLTNFQESIKNGLYTSSIELTEEGEFKKNLKTVKKSLDKVVSEHHAVLLKKNDELTDKSLFVKQLQTQLKQLEKEYETKKNIMENLQTEYENSVREVQQMETKKLCIKTYKLATGTSLTYKQNETSGYIGEMGSRDVKPFVFKHSDYTPEQIQENLWKLVETAYKKQS